MLVKAKFIKFIHFIHFFFSFFLLFFFFFGCTVSGQRIPYNFFSFFSMIFSLIYLVTYESITVYLKKLSNFYYATVDAAEIKSDRRFLFVSTLFILFESVNISILSWQKFYFVISNSSTSSLSEYRAHSTKVNFL